jgi:hypothetical protein
MHMDWLLTGENFATLMAIGGACLFAIAGALLGQPPAVVRGGVPTAPKSEASLQPQRGRP